MRLDGEQGRLTRLGKVLTGESPVSVVSVDVSPDEGIILVANRSSNNLSVFELDASNGALSEVGRVAARDGPVSLAVY